MKNMPSFEEMERWLGQKFFKYDCSDIILCVFILAYVIAFSTLTILRHYVFKSLAWDLGIFTQSLWTTLFAGKFFYHTCELFINPSGSFFGVHFSPILFFLLPLYALFPRAETLLVFQATTLSLASIPIYKLAKEYAGGRVVGLTFALAYLMYPATQFVNWYDYHVQTFFPLFFGFAIYYSVKEKWSKYFVFIFLALMCEEHAAFIAFFIGIYIAWRYRNEIILAIKRKRPIERKIFVPLITIVVAIVWYWFTLWQRNTFFPTNPVALEDFLGSPNFTILGAKDPLEIPLLIILKPLSFLQALTYDWQIKVFYFFVLFGPLAFFSLKAPSALIPTIPWFGFSIVSQTVAHHILGHQYEAYIVSFIFIAAIFGIRKTLLKSHSLKVYRSLKKLLICSIIFSITISPTSFLVASFFPSYTSFYAGFHEESLHNVLAMVPSNASILTQDNIFPHVSYRVEAYVIPNRFLTTTIRDLAIEFVLQTMDKVEYILVDNRTDPVATALVIALFGIKPEFNLINSADNGTILLYQRKH